MKHTEHLSPASALATAAEHFVSVGGVVHAFTDEDACWRFVQIRRQYQEVTYSTRRELAA